MAKKKHYSEKQRYLYHRDRDMACGRYGIKFGSPKHCYSSGFSDAFHLIDNSSATTREFGRKSGFAYRKGLRRGEKARVEYTKKTGKQSWQIDFEKD